MTRVRKSPLPFGVHRVHHHKIAMDYGSDIGVSIAFRRSPRSPRGGKILITFTALQGLHCLSAFTAFTTLAAQLDGLTYVWCLHCLSAFTAFTTQSCCD